MSKTNHRNYVAREMATNSHYKSKSFSNDRSNRRKNDTKNDEVYNFIHGFDNIFEEEDSVVSESDLDLLNWDFDEEDPYNWDHEPEYWEY
jgi:esterase/lipase superfamily enzyme